MLTEITYLIENNYIFKKYIDFLKISLMPGLIEYS